MLDSPETLFIHSLTSTHLTKFYRIPEPIYCILVSPMFVVGDGLVYSVKVAKVSDCWLMEMCSSEGVDKWGFRRNQHCLARETSVTGEWGNSGS